MFFLASFFRSFLSTFTVVGTDRLVCYLVSLISLTGSVANFYSPLESPADSENEEEEEDSQISQDSGIRIPRRNRRNILVTAAFLAIFLALKGAVLWILR
jgi:uncharacterized membrane protein